MSVKANRNYQEVLIMLSFKTLFITLTVSCILRWQTSSWTNSRVNIEREEKREEKREREREDKKRERKPRNNAE